MTRGSVARRDIGRFGAGWLLCAVWLALQPAPAAAEEAGPALDWAVYEAGPFSILSGPDRERGIFDRIRHILSARLDDYRQRTVTVPFPRILGGLQNDTPWCFVGGIRTPERDAFAVFSLPVAMLYPLRIIVRAPARARFAALGPLSLETLLQDGRRWRTGVLRGRSLAPKVDALLRQHPPGYVYSDFEDAFRMLLNDRLDYLIEVPSLATYNARRLGAEGAFAALPLAETPEPVFPRVMCPRTPWGRAVIERVDAVLRTERPGPAYRAIVESWAEPEERAMIRAAYDSFLATP